MISERSPSDTWSRVKERLGVALWSSFLAAAGEFALFFAFFDPWVLAREAAAPAWLMDRSAAYATGFFFFWASSFAGAALTAYMLDTSRNAAARADKGAP